MVIKKYDKPLMLEPYVKIHKANRARLDSWVRCVSCVMVKYLITNHLFSLKTCGFSVKAVFPYFQRSLKPQFTSS